MFNIIKPENIDKKQIAELFRFYTNDLRPIVAEMGTQELTGYHGLTTHTDAVVFRGIDCALSLNQNAMPVVFAFAFHDMARTDDDFNLQHGPNAVPLAKIIMNKYENLLDDKSKEMILFAIANHTNGEIAPDYVSACLWDADRIRLSWGYGYESRFYNTERGDKIASGAPENYLDLQKQCIPDHKWDKTY